MPRFAVLTLLLAPVLHGQVEGVVVNRVTGSGIGGVAVVLYTRQAIQYETITDDSGRFRTMNMRPGSYQVRYEKTRFKPFREDPVAPYAIEPGSGVRLRLEMTPLVTLRGRALNGNGEPARRAQVRIGTFFAFVDEHGEFEFDQLQPGSYTMLAEPGPSSPSKDRIEPVQTVFPRRIVVRGDADLSGYEIRLQSVPVHRVRGVVRDEAGQPALATIRLLSVVRLERQALGGAASDYFLVVGPEQADGPLLASTTSAEDGSFEFPSVPSGDWRIAVDAATRLGEAPISVGRSDIDDLEIRLTRQVLFTMNVDVDWGGAPAAPALLNTLPGRKVIFTDRLLRLQNVRSGRYRLVPGAAPGVYPSSALFGGSEVLGHTVDLVAGSPALRIFYKTATGNVHGTASPNSTVVLLPTAGYGRIARCDSTGAFAIGGVAPGDYFISAFEGFDTSFLTDPDLLNKIAASGTKVTVGASPVAGLDLKAIRWPE
jgi:hypothetical protein